jgi:hypothetical protein
VIRAKSGFFRAACSSRWREGLERVVRLPEVQPKLFQVYIHWAYTETVVLGAATTFSPMGKPTCRGLVDLYLLGDVLDDTKLRNKAIQLLSVQVTEHSAPSCQTISHIWSKTPTTSILRKWTVDVTIMNLNRVQFAENAESCPADYVFQVATKLLQQTDHVGRETMKEKLASPEYLEPESDASVPEV